MKCCYSKSILYVTLEYLQISWLDWFYFYILGGGQIVFLKDGTIFLSLLLDVLRIVMSAFPFLVQVECGILRMQNVL